MSAPQVSIVVPNYNSGGLLRVCLASVVRFTTAPHRLLVVDHGSDDASRETAEGAAERGLIELIRRGEDPADGAPSHGANLDAGLAAADTPYVFTLDSDAWARRPGWLRPWVEALERLDASHSGATKFPGSAGQRLGAWLTGKQPGHSHRYIRPCHALYRVDVLRRHGLSFVPTQAPDGRWRTTGQTIHERLVELGYRPAILSHARVEAHVGHLRHSSFVLNPERFPTLRARAQRRGERRIRRLLDGAEARAILADSQIP